jgi:hypothetical protein
MGITTKNVKLYCTNNNIAWATTTQGHKFCPSFHIKGMCNTRCGFAADHVQHTAAEDAALITWCATNYKTE